MALECPDLPAIEFESEDGHTRVYLDTGFGAGAYVCLPCTLDTALAALAQSVLAVHR